MSGESGAGFFGRFKPDYDSVFVEEWPAYLGGIMVVLVILGLMVSGLFWGVFGGLKLWGASAAAAVAVARMNCRRVEVAARSLRFHFNSRLNVTFPEDEG